MLLYSIGYEGLSSQEFIALIKTHNIDTLIDIRELPLSRKKGFSKTALSSELQKNGVSYVHKSSLGCPREIRHQYRKDRDWIKYSIQFLDYISKQEESINWLINNTQKAKCCIMCFEKDFAHCHRSYIINILSKKIGASFKSIELRDQETKEFEIPLLVGKLDQLATIDPGICVEYLKENEDLFC